MICGLICKIFSQPNHGARVTQGICDGFTLLDASDHNYDMEKVRFDLLSRYLIINKASTFQGYTRHAISTKPADYGIIIELGNIYLINYIKILLWDLDNRSYSYVSHCVRRQQDFN